MKMLLSFVHSHTFINDAFEILTLVKFIFNFLTHFTLLIGIMSCDRDEESSHLTLNVLFVRRKFSIQRVFPCWISLYFKCGNFSSLFEVFLSDGQCQSFLFSLRVFNVSYLNVPDMNSGGSLKSFENLQEITFAIFEILIGMCFLNFNIFFQSALNYF